MGVAPSGHQKITGPLVMDQTPGSGVKCSRIPDGVAGDVQILGEEELQAARAGVQIFHPDLAQVDIFMKIDRVPAGHEQAQLRMVQVHSGYRGIGFKGLLQTPPLWDPAKMISGQEAETAHVAADMIFLSHMGKVEIPDPIVVVKADQKLTVSHRNVAGHG